MTIHDIEKSRIESYIRSGIEQSFDSCSMSLVAIQDVNWSRTDEEEDEPAQVSIEASIILLYVDNDLKTIKINITREGYLFTEEAFEQSLKDYGALVPDINWYEGLSDEHYSLSGELPVGLDFIIIRFLSGEPGRLFLDLYQLEDPEKIIQKIKNKRLREAFSTAWQNW